MELGKQLLQHNKNNMGNKILVPILIIIIVILGYLWLSKSPEIVYDTSKLDSLSTQIINNEKKLSESLYTIDSLEVQITEIVQQRDGLVRQMGIYKTNYENQLKVINNGNVADDIEFFSSRFSKATNN